MNPNSAIWTPTDYDGTTMQILKAADRLLKTAEAPRCPICEEAFLRFYYRQFIQHESLSPRGTLWVWCPHCKHWHHTSGVALPKGSSYTDPLSREQFSDIDGILLIRSLNALWEDGAIPHSMA